MVEQVKVIEAWAQEVEPQVAELHSSMPTIGKESVENFRSSSAYRDELTAVALEFF